MQDLRAKLAALGLFSALAFAGGCASPVPGSVSTGSGKSITVTIHCYGPMYSTNYYYFLINRYVTAGNSTGNQKARGPIPVLDSAVPGSNSNGPNGYGNGFATGSQNVANLSGDNGITDYVLYSNFAPNSLALYHISGPVDVPGAGQPVSTPVANTIPDTTNVDDPNAATTLSFTIYTSQLLTSAETVGKTPAQITALANSIRWLQVNIVATNIVPTAQGPQSAKWWIRWVTQLRRIS